MKPVFVVAQPTPQPPAVLATIGGFVGISPAFAGGQHVGGRLNIVN